MSSSHATVVPVAFSEDILRASLVIGTSSSSAVTDFLRGGLSLAGDAFNALFLGSAALVGATAIGLNEVRKEGSEVGRQIGLEAIDFIAGGATMGASMTQDLAVGAKADLLYGVKEGGKLFTAAVGASELLFERCGGAIVGRLVNDDQEAIDRETAKRIADAYQRILEEIGNIAAGKDALMSSHQESMEKSNQALLAIVAQKQAIEDEIQSLKTERNRAKGQMQTLNEETDQSTTAALKEAKATFEKTVQELQHNIQLKEAAKAALAEQETKATSEHKEHLKIMKRLEERQGQSKEIIDVHGSRVKEHTTQEIKRMMSEHGMVNPTIELSELENNRIRIHIEE